VATILFTDIVGSTELAAEVGDSDWRRRLEEHDQRAAEATRRAGGTIVKTTGDGILALFDGPSRAIHAAQNLQGAVKDLGLELRAAVHTGEVEHRNDDVAGLGVHIAARLLSLGCPDGVVASRTAKELAAGSGITFESLGTQVLKGVPGEHEIYVVPPRG
jgi:class 3 adenylate cyclase